MGLSLGFWRQEVSGPGEVNPTILAQCIPLKFTDVIQASMPTSAFKHSFQNPEPEPVSPQTKTRTEVLSHVLPAV